MIVPTYKSEILRPMNGLFFIHAITLCKDQDIINPIADAAKYHPYTGSGANMNVPWARAKINYREDGNVSAYIPHQW